MPREIIEVRKDEYLVARGGRTDKISWSTLDKYMIVPSKVDARWISRSESMVENAPLRDAFIQSGEKAVDVCWRLGLTEERDGHKRAQPGRLKRALGMAYDHQKGYRTVRATTNIDQAKAICEAIGAEFDELYPDLVQASSGHTCTCGNPMIDDADKCGLCIEEMGQMERAT
jgi:hypothetical protein